MPVITSVSLSLQRNGSHNPSSSRIVVVKFTTRFSEWEILAAALFNTNIKIEAVDGAVFGDPTLLIGLGNITAREGSVESSYTIHYTRSELDEDKDSFIWYDQYGHPHRFSEEMVDKWRAKVELRQVVNTITSYSPVVTGSWGSEGDD